MGCLKVVGFVVGMVLMGPILFLVVGGILFFISGGLVLVVGTPGIIVFALVCLLCGGSVVVSSIEKQEQQKHEERLRKAAIAKLDEQEKD